MATQHGSHDAFGACCAGAPRAKVLWISRRHHLFKVQEETIRSAFGAHVRIDIYHGPYDDARKIAAYYRKGQYKALFVVLPDPVIRALLEEGVPVWRSRLENGEFVRFEKIESMPVHIEATIEASKQ